MSGTEEGREIVKRLSEKGEKVITTVATEYGHEIYEQIGLGHICLQGRLDMTGLSELIREYDIKTLVDATHPYAIQASVNAIKASERSGINYIRFQRPASVTGMDAIEELHMEGQVFVHIVDSTDDAVEWCRKSDKRRILLTTGFSATEKFVRLKDEKEIYVRILPVPSHIEQCIHMGIKPSNILALQGPFSTELNEAVINQYRIDIVVTKDSGKTGGVPEKILAAGTTGADIVVIRREEIEYPVKCSSLDELFSMLGCK